MATVKPAQTLSSQALTQPTRIIYLRQTDPTLDLPLTSDFGGLDNRRYQTGDFLIHNGASFNILSVENSGDVLVVDSTRNTVCKWTNSLSIGLFDLEILNAQKPAIQNNLDLLIDESLSIGMALTNIDSDKQQLQNNITALNLYVGGQEAEITDINTSLISLNSNIQDTIITIDNLDAGLDAITIRINNVNSDYTSNIDQINLLSNIITESETNIQNQELTSTGTINTIINGDFLIWQRSVLYGPGANTTPYPTADRWYHCMTHGGLLTSSQVQVTLTDQTIVNGLRITVTGNPNEFYLAYLLEDVNSIISDQSISLWLKSPINTTLTLTVIQNFGTGGSAPVTVGSTNITFSSLTNFTWSFTLPSTSGKTIGTGSYICFKLSGSNWASVDLCRVQLQNGTHLYAFEERQYQSEMRLCQRYYETGYDVFSGYLDANQISYCAHTYKVEKRTTPTVKVTQISQSQFTPTVGVGLVNNTISGSTYCVKNNRTNFGSYVNRYFADAEIYI